MIDRDDFLQAICSAPDDDLPRLVFADWLEEHDEPERAEFIRVQCELVKIGPAWKDGGPGRLEARHVGGGEYVLETFDAPPIGSRLDARAIWITKKKSGLLRGLRVIRVGAAQGSDGFPVNAIRDEYSGNTAARRIKTLQRREQELFKLHGYQWADVFSGYKMEQIGQGLSGTTVTARYLFPDESMTDQFRFEFRRGFIESITCSAEDWLAHEAALTWCVRTCPRCVNGKQNDMDIGDIRYNEWDCHHCSGTGKVPPMVACNLCKGGGQIEMGVLGFVEQDPSPNTVATCPACSGSGRVPRPFLSMAQPIREVRLTIWIEPTWANGANATWGVCQYDPTRQTFTSDRWPGIIFHLPRVSE